MKRDDQLGIIPFDDDVDLVSALRKDGHARLKIYRPERVRVVLGRGSNVGQEIHLDAIQADSVSLERRPGGGCAVVLDPGNVIVSVVLPVPGLGDTKIWFQRCCCWLANGLEGLGVGKVQVDGISDLVIGDRKIAGTALHRSKDLLYFSASLLVTPDLTLLERYLPHPPREPEYRNGRDHLDFVTSLHDAAGIGDVSEFVLELERVLEVEELVGMGRIH